MNQIAHKLITMNSAQINLTYIMVRVIEINNRERHELHEKVKSKLFQSKTIVRNGNTIIFLNEAERAMLRQYNTDYCTILGELVESHEDHNVKNSDYDLEFILDTYAKATEIQKLLAH